MNSWRIPGYVFLFAIMLGFAIAIYQRFGVWGLFAVLGIWKFIECGVDTWYWIVEKAETPSTHRRVY